MKRYFGVVILACCIGCGVAESDEAGAAFHFVFDLHDGLESSGKPLLLHVNGEKYSLSAHDDASYQDMLGARGAGVRREDVSHFVSGLSLRRGALTHMYVTEGDPHTDAHHRLLFSFYHREPEEGAGGVGDSQNQVCKISAAVAMVFKHPELVTDDPEKAALIMWHINPVAPELMCDPKQEHRSEIIDLATAIHRAIRDEGSVAVNEPFVTYSETPPADEAHNYLYWVEEPDETFSLIQFRGGTPFYAYRFTDDEDPVPLPFEGDLTKKTRAAQYRILDDVLEAATPALQVALNSTKNDPALEGVKYSILEGAGPLARSAAVDVDLHADGDSGERIVLSRTGKIDGMSLQLDSHRIDDEGVRLATVEVKNYYLRHVALFVKWKKPDGSHDTWWKDAAGEDGITPSFYSALGLPSWYAFFNDMAGTDDSLFFGFVANRAVIMGVPLAPDPTYFKIPIPPSSSQATLLFASLGTGLRHNESIPGSILTAIIDIGIPAYFLISGIRDGIGGEPILKDAITDPKVLTTIVSLGVAMGLYGQSKVGGSSDYKPYAKALGSILVSTGCDRLRYAIAKAAVKSEAENAVPFIGWGLYLAGLAANASQLTQTIAEVASTPAIHENSVVATWSPRVRILPDPANIRGGYPESAVSFDARVFFGDHQAARLPQKGESAAIGNTAGDPLDFVFRDIPEGGAATIQISLLAETGWVAGVAIGQVPNEARLAPPDEEGINYTLQLVENLVNITADTDFSHKDRIGRDEQGRYVWLGYEDAERHYVAPPPPEKTVTSLDCSSTNGGLCSLHGISLNIASHSVGYSWQGFAEGMPICGTPTPSSGQRHFVQHLSLLNNAVGGPESFYVPSQCNDLTYRPALAYQLVGDVDGDHVFVFPAEVDGGLRFFVQRVALDETLTFDERTHAVGWLALPSTDAAVHPAGHLVSINRSYGKMEIVDLSGATASLEDAPPSRIALGEGTREGLLSGPVAVTVSHEGDILVLEQANLRVSAFDVHGSVRRIFGAAEGVPRNSFQLQDVKGATVLLDIDVESTGMIFVLGYRNAGQSSADYFLQIYSPDGVLIDSVAGVAAGKMAVDHFRNVFTLNYDGVIGGMGLIEPSISLWAPQP